MHPNQTNVIDRHRRCNSFECSNKTRKIYICLLLLLASFEHHVWILEIMDFDRILTLFKFRSPLNYNCCKDRTRKLWITLELFKQGLRTKIMSILLSSFVLVLQF